MKNGLALFFVFLSTIGLVSAQGGISDLLSQIDQATVILFGIFLVVFALLFFALNKAFKGNTAIAGIISAVISFLIVYSVNKSGLDLNNYFYTWGISQGLLSTLIPIVIILAAVFLIVMLKQTSLFIFGGALIVLSFFVYAQTLLIVVGVILAVVGLILMGKNRDKKKGKEIRLRI